MNTSPGEVSNRQEGGLCTLPHKGRTVDLYCARSAAM